MSIEERYTERAVQTEGMQTSTNPSGTEDGTVAVDVRDVADVSVSSVSSDIFLHALKPTPRRADTRTYIRERVANNPSAEALCGEENLRGFAD